MYREALRLRREFNLGSGSLAWVDGVGDEQAAVAFANRDVLVVTNLGDEPVELPEGATVLLASGDLVTEDGRVSVPTDVAVWARLS